MKHWTERWPARGPYAVGENRLCLLTRGPLAAKGRSVEGESPTQPVCVVVGEEKAGHGLPRP